MDNANYKILIVDDEPDILELIEYNLKKEGYQVFTATNGQDAISEAKRSSPNLIILDIMMPILDGIEACRILRDMPEFRNTFMVFLTARTEEYSEIAGFNAGADDYITKPIKHGALISRINAILKRNLQFEEVVIKKLVIADLIIDHENFLVYRRGQKLSLPRKQFQLLYLLASRPGKVYSREVILKNIWVNSLIVTNRSIDVHVRNIRAAIGDKYISTVKGVGYKFDMK